MNKSILFLTLIASACSETEVKMPNEVQSFSLTQFSPANESIVDSASVLSADFSWDLNVLEFYPDVYYVRFVFYGNLGFIYPEQYVFSDMYAIKSVRGAATLNYPLSKIFSNTSVKHPLRVRLELLTRVSDVEIRPLEQSATIRYNE